MVSKQKRFSVSLVIREMRIKDTVYSLYTLIRTAKMKTIKIVTLYRWEYQLVNNVENYLALISKVEHTLILSLNNSNLSYVLQETCSKC